MLFKKKIIENTKTIEDDALENWVVEWYKVYNEYEPTWRIDNLLRVSPSYAVFSNKNDAKLFAKSIKKARSLLGENTDSVFVYKIY